MKITKEKLKQIIKEELEAVIAQEGIFDKLKGGLKDVASVATGGQTRKEIDASDRAHDMEKWLRIKKAGNTDLEFDEWRKQQKEKGYSSASGARVPTY